MKEVNTLILNSNLRTLDKSLDDYNLIYLNFYNEIKLSHLDANSNRFTKFYNATDEEKITTRNFYLELVKFKKIYEYIYNNYQTIGEIIKFDLDGAESALNSFEQLKSKAKSLKASNSNIQSSLCPGISGLISSNNNLLSSMVETLETLYKEYDKIFRKIDEIEKSVKSQAGGLHIQPIKETDIKEFIGGDV